MSAIKKLVSQTAIYGLSSIVGRLLNYLLVPLYTNLFVPQEYGVVTELYAYVAFFAVILTYGMETAFFRFVQNEPSRKDTVYSTSLISLLTSTVVFVFFGVFFKDTISGYLGYQNHTWYITCFVFVIAIDAITALPFALLRYQNRALRFVGVRLVNIFVNIALNLFFILLCPYLLKHDVVWVRSFYNPEIGVGYIFISNLVASAVTVLLLLPQFRFKLKFDTVLWKQLLTYAFPLLFVGLAGMVNETADRVMLKFLLPSGTNVMAATGIYGACYKISIIMTIFIQTFRYAAEPFFFSHANNKDAKQIYADVMKYFVIACGIIFLITLLFMDVVKFFVGKDYWEGLFIVPVLLLANWFLGIYYNLTIWYKLTNKTSYGAYISAMGALLTIILNYLLIPKLGYFGAACTTLLCYTAMMVTSFYQGEKHFPIPYNTKRIGIYILLALGIYVIYYEVKIENFVVQLFFSTMLLSIYLIVVYVLEKNDLRFMLNQKESNE